MQGVFESAAANVPAVKITGTNGADGADAACDSGTALTGASVRGIGVAAISNGAGGIGLRAVSDLGWAVNAQSKSGVGILGASDTNVGIQGECQSGYNFGVVGTGANAGVAAFNPTNNHAAYLASACCAAWFTGDVTVTGRLFKGGGGFRIDHPLSPEDHFLAHSFVEFVGDEEFL